MKSKPIVLIMCGGRSLRLWPLSESKSKNFLDIFGFSPLELTIKRFSKVTDVSNIFLVASSQEKKQIERLRLVKKENIFYEPRAKNTAAAVIYSLKCLQKTCDFSQTLIIAPVDHFIKNETEFYKALKDALSLASKGGICTLGIEPDEPTPKFGYIKTANRLGPQEFKVAKFIEKPTRELAASFIKEGGYFFNSGMFISKLEAINGEFKKYYQFYQDFEKVFSAKKIPSLKTIDKLYQTLSDEPFDKAVMEKTTQAFMVKANFYWKDFGSWNTVFEMLPKDSQGNAIKGKVFPYQAKNNLVHLENGKSKKVLIAGVSDIVFIDTPQYSLIISQSALDDLKSAIKEFKSALI